jgi:hypothetical protein
MNIYQRLNTIREKVAYIRKDKKVENYTAVSHDAVVAETRQWFIEVGVIILPSVMSSAMIDTGCKSQKGNPLYRYEGRFIVRFQNCDDPLDFASVEVDAHANDYGDKAPGKAITYATKSAILKVLFLETGDNDEARTTLNMAPGDEVGSDDLAVMIQAIKDAKTLDSLLEVYAAAYARAEKDKDAKDAIVKAKNERQIFLKGASRLAGGLK